VVRLAYAHLSAAAASDSAIRRREDRLRATGRATAPFSITFVSSSSSSSSSSSTNSPANNNNNSPRGRVGDGSGRLLGASSANYNGSSSGGGFGGAQSRGMAFGGSASSRGYGRSGGGAEGRALPEDLLQRALSSVHMFALVVISFDLSIVPIFSDFVCFVCPSFTSHFLITRHYYRVTFHFFFFFSICLVATL